MATSVGIWRRRKYSLIQDRQSGEVNCAKDVGGFVMGVARGLYEVGSPMVEPLKATEEGETRFGSARVGNQYSRCFVLLGFCKKLGKRLKGKNYRSCD